LSNKGEPGEKGGPNGDLIITFYVKSHNHFKRDGQNLYLDVPITFTQAALGAEITVPTMDGHEKYNVKPGTQPGTIAYIKGKGMPHVKNERIVGDLIIKLNVSVPTKLTDKQKEKLKEFANEMGQDISQMSNQKKGRFKK